MNAGDILKQPVGWVVLGFLLAVVGGLIRGSGQGLAETDRITHTGNRVLLWTGRAFLGVGLVLAVPASLLCILQLVFWFARTI